MKQREGGFALFISLILLIILTFIGFGFASRGKLSSQIAKTNSRYEAVTAAAEDEMFRLTSLLNNTQDYIPTGDGVTLNGAGTTFTQVWSSNELAADFGAVAQPVFDNFNNPGWRIAPITQIVNSEYGQIETQGFVQELVKKVAPTTGDITVQYLITVKAFSQNPGEEATNTERESIAIQTLTPVRFGRARKP